MRVVLFNGFGEETGWRGFALAPLQRRFGAVTGTFVLALLWAACHTPTFFVVETYRAMTLRMLAGGFGLGLCTGALVLSRIAQRTGGSILAAALWHAAYNMTSATAASRGIIAAVTTTAVMVWAVALLVAAARRGGQGSQGDPGGRNYTNTHSEKPRLKGDILTLLEKGTFSFCLDRHNLGYLPKEHRFGTLFRAIEETVKDVYRSKMRG